MVKSAIKVVVRVRPTPEFASSAIELHQDKKVGPVSSYTDAIPPFSTPSLSLCSRASAACPWPPWPAGGRLPWRSARAGGRLALAAGGGGWGA